MQQPAQVDDRQNLAPNRQHTQHVVGNVGNLLGSLYAQNLPDMLHVEREFFFGDAKGDHLGIGVGHCSGGCAGFDNLRTCGDRGRRHAVLRCVEPMSQTCVAFRAMTMRCPLSSFTTPRGSRAVVPRMAGGGGSMSLRKHAGNLFDPIHAQARS